MVMAVPFIRIGMRFRRDDKGYSTNVCSVNKPPGTGRFVCARASGSGSFGVFTAYCAVSALPSARNRDRHDAMGHVHARVQEIHGHRDIPDKTEGTNRSDNKVDSMDKDRTGIQGRILEYQGLLGFEGLF